MLTVLAGQSPSDLSAFMQNRHSKPDTEQGRFTFFGNHNAIIPWLQALGKLIAKGENPQDGQMIDLIKTMLCVEQEARITAPHLVRRISQLEGLYHGHCCRITVAPSVPTGMGPLRQDSWRSETSAIQDLGSDYSSDSEVGEDVFGADTIFTPPIPSKRSTCYLPPSMEDVENTTMIVAGQHPKFDNILLEDVTILVSSEKDLSAGREHIVANSIDVAVHPKRLLGTDMALHPPSDSSSSSTSSPDSKHEQSEHIVGLPCPWPKCKPPRGLAFQTFDGVEYLRQHLRDVHLVHDLGRTCLLEGGRDRSATLSLTTKNTPLRILGLPQRANQNNIRFSDLPVERRPVPVERVPAKAKTSHATYSICAEMPTPPGEASPEQFQACNQLKIPPSTFVPSYVLGKFRFVVLDMSLINAL